MAKSNELPDGRVRQWADIPGEVFRVEVGDLVSFRGEEGIVASSDQVVRQFRLEGWERTLWAPWHLARIVHSAQELQDAANAPAEPEPAPKGKSK